MSVVELLSELSRKGVQVSVDGEQLRFRGPKSALTPELMGRLAERKPEILEVFQRSGDRQRIEGGPISRADRSAAIPLSEVQRELWLAEQLSASPSAKVVLAAIRLTGALDSAALGRGLGEVANRHESLRTTFAVQDGEPVQKIHPTIPDEVPPAPDRWTEFDLEHGPLFRTRLERVSSDEHILHIAAHHLIFDVESVWILLRDLAHALNSTAAPALPIQYADFSAWRRPADDAGIQYWKRRLEDAPSILELPARRPRAAVRQFRSLRSGAPLSPELTRALRNCAKNEGVTPFVFLLSCVSVLLARYTGQDDILIGSPVSGRLRPEIEGLIGSFAYPLVLRADLSGSCTFRDLLLRLRETALGAFAHQHIPFGRVLEAAQPERRPGTSPLFQVMFTHPPAQKPVHLQELTLEPITDRLEGTAEYDLLLSAVESGDGMDLAIIYPDDLFEPGVIAGMLSDFIGIVQGVTASPGLPLDGLIELPGSIAELTRIENTLRRAPSVADCAVLARGSDVVAYVAPAGQIEWNEIQTGLGTPLAGVVPVSHIPLTENGTVDKQALSRLPVIDSALVESVESAANGTIILALRETTPLRTNLHLSDLLSAGEPVGGVPSTSFTPVAGPQATEDEIAQRPWALSDGGPLTLPPGAPKTLTAALLRTAAECGHNGIIFVGAQDEISQQTWAELLTAAKQMLAGLQAAGLHPKDRVILQIGDLRLHFEAFWGCVLGGIVPVTVAISPTYTEKTGVVNKLFNTWRLLERPAIVTSASLVPSIEGLNGLLPMDGLRVLPVEDLLKRGISEEMYDPSPDDLVFFQLTSGSTGTPKCIQETHRAIIAQIHGSHQFNGYRDDDVNLNWLPMDHVVPILTCHLKDAYLGCNEVQVRTDVVLSAPGKWLDLIEKFRVTHTWAPNFGFRLVTEALKSLPGRTWDLSSLRFLMNAGEQVTTAVVHEFLKAVAPFGVRPEAMQPAFGMAESCTCITWQNGFDLHSGHRRIVKSTLSGALLEGGRDDENTTDIVDLGPPMRGIKIRIADSNNLLRKEGFIGRFQIKGDVVTPGYLYNDEANREAFVGDGWFNSGDLGFILDGRLFLTGREKETIIIRGANFYCYEIEDVVNRVDGVEPTFSAACAIPDTVSGTEELGIFFVPQSGALPVISAIRAGIARELGISPAVIVPLEKKDFPKTTSGKIQRTQLRKAFEAGHFNNLLKELDLRLGNANTLPAWFYRKVWRPRQLSSGSPLPSTVAIFRDSEGLGDCLISELTAAGAACTSVADCGALLDLAATGARIDLIVDLRPYQPGAAISSQMATLALLDLAGALHECGDRIGNPGLLVASSGVANGGLTGLLRTMPRELPWLRCRQVDLEPGDLNVAARHLLNEIISGDGEAEISYRAGRRLATRLHQVVHPQPAQESAPAFARGGAYVISGGLGGLGVEIARFLLTRYNCRLLLTGSTKRRDALESLGNAGGEVRFAQMDVGDVPALKCVVDDALNAWGCGLAGVIHLAGVLRENTLTDETRESFSETARAKISGALALHELVKDKPGALVVHFSSANAFFGGFRAGAYSAANAFLDRLAEYQRAVCGLRSYSLAWSMWDEIGMSRGYSFKELSRNQGFMSIGVSQGLQSMLIALRQEPSNVLIGLDATKPAVRRYVEVKPWSLISLAGWRTPGASIPQITDRFGIRVPCVVDEVDPAAVTATGAIDRGRLIEKESQVRNTQAERAIPRNEMERTIAAVWKELLKIPEVGVNENFFDLGGHSVLLMQVHNRLTQSLGRDFPMLDLLSFPTIAALAAHLGRENGTHRSLDAAKDRAAIRRQSMGAAARLQAART